MFKKQKKLFPYIMQPFFSYICTFKMAKSYCPMKFLLSNRI